MRIAEVRPLLTPENPFVLGRHPARLAPVHLMNGFVGAALGVSPRGASVRTTLAERGSNAGAAASTIPFLVHAEWKTDPARYSAFRTDFSLMFNPDARM